MNTEIKRFCDIIRETSFAIHKFHGHGHLEKVYENALNHRLNKAGISAESQLPLIVRDEDGTIMVNISRTFLSIKS